MYLDMINKNNKQRMRSLEVDNADDMSTNYNDNGAENLQVPKSFKANQTIPFKLKVQKKPKDMKW